MGWDPITRPLFYYNSAEGNVMTSSFVISVRESGREPSILRSVGLIGRYNRVSST